MNRGVRVVVRPAVEIVLERGESNWGAYAPAFPGAVGIADSALEAQRSVEQSLTLAFEELLREAEGCPTPIPDHPLDPLAEELA